MKDQSFYNTINLEARELIDAQRAALTQERRILRFMLKRGSDSPATPSMVRKLEFTDCCPLTSVRRGISNLTKGGDLIKLETMQDGLYGKPEHLWTVSAKWTPAQPTQGELL